MTTYPGQTLTTLGQLFSAISIMQTCPRCEHSYEWNSHFMASIRQATFGNSFHGLINCTNTKGNPLHYFDTFDKPIVKNNLCEGHCLLLIL
jgi:hypothetical protein